MSWLRVPDFGAPGWSGDVDSCDYARHYCEQLERGAILFFPEIPFDLPAEHRNFLTALTPGDSRFHKSISYRPGSDLLRGLDNGEAHTRVHEIMRHYAGEVRRFVCGLLAPYSDKLQMDYASFRPVEEQGRDLSLHKRNDLLHVDAFPRRPTRGGRILRVFTNLNPNKARVWFVGERFPKLAQRLARESGLAQFAKESSLQRRIQEGFERLGLIPDRSQYDRFMLHFHDWLKENAAFQEQSEGKECLEFPPMATWLVFTDGVPHSALSGQFAVEQTFIIPLDALVAPEASPIRVLEKLSGRAMA